MIRLLVVTEDESRWRDIASRLRNAIVESRPRARLSESLAGCDGVVFVEHADRTDIERPLRADKHVLQAGEMSFSSADWEVLTKLAQERKVQLACVNPDRYLPSRQLIKQQIPDKLGHAGLVRMHRWEAAATNERVLPRASLRDLDLALWLFDKNPEILFALDQGETAQRFVQVHLGFPGGGMALIDYDGRLPAGDGYYSLSVIGENGAAYADDHQNMQIAFRGGRPQAIRNDEGVKQWADLVRTFANVLSAGQDLSGLATNWKIIGVLADAVKQSLASRCAIRLEGR